MGPALFFFSDLLHEEEAVVYSTFLKLVESEEYAFEEIYCSAFLYLEAIWVWRISPPRTSG